MAINLTIAARNLSLIEWARFACLKAAIIPVDCVPAGSGSSGWASCGERTAPVRNPPACAGVILTRLRDVIVGSRYYPRANLPGA